MHKTIYPNGFRVTPKVKLMEVVKGMGKIVDTCWSRDRYANGGKGQDNITAVLVEFNK